MRADGRGSAREALEVCAEARRHFFSLFTPRVPRHAGREAERAFMEQGEPLHVPLSEGHLEVRSWGSGPTVLLVHGLHLSGGTFRFVVPALVQAGLRAVALDVPGHGASDGRFVDDRYIANALLTVEERLGELSGLVAHSMGVVWTLHALDAGLQVPRVVWIGSPLVLESCVDYYVKVCEVPMDVESELRRLAASFSVGLPSVREMAARINADALILHDRDDFLAPFQGAEELSRVSVHHRTFWTTRLGHHKTLSEPRAIAAIVEHLRCA